MYHFEKNVAKISIHFPKYWREKTISFLTNNQQSLTFNQLANLHFREALISIADNVFAYVKSCKT